MKHRISMTLNGELREAEVDGQDTLLTVLHRCFRLTGARESCGAGVCGACTVEVDGAPVSSCLYWAVLADRTEVVTVEGLSEGGELSSLQQEFLDKQGFQCGYCTPGMLMMCRSLLAENPDPDVEAVRDYLIGSICRCGAYPEILQAVLATAARMRESRGKVPG